MAEFINHKIFHIAQKTLDHSGLQEYLDYIGVPDWQSNAPSDEEELIEVCGKLCYRSFAVELNSNLTRVRDDNEAFIKNILKSKHGRVLEPADDTYIITGCSRIFTHELVRHNSGVSYSQESLRFVRLDNHNLWFPNSLSSHPNSTKMRVIFDRAMHQAENNIKELYELIDIDNLKNFDEKKKYTSAVRRLALEGIGTSISVTANQRAWRYIIAARTNRHAEEEIRLVISMIFDDLKERYPHIFMDSKKEIIDGIAEITFENEKV